MSVATGSYNCNFNHLGFYRPRSLMEMMIPSSLEIYQFQLEVNLLYSYLIITICHLHIVRNKLECMLSKFYWENIVCRRPSSHFSIK